MSEQAFDLVQLAIARKRALEDNHDKYQRGLIPPHYPVPAIPISFDYDVCGETVYLDMWEGIEYCRHYVWATE